jgi:hypothetical protein
VDGRIVRQKKVGAVHPNRLRAIEVNRVYLCGGTRAACKQPTRLPLQPKKSKNVLPCLPELLEEA